MLIKEYLSVYFKLKPELIVEDANLYVLAIFSMFFREQAEGFGITQDDVDPGALKQDTWDIKHYRETREIFRIYLDRYLRSGSRSCGRPVYFDDPVGADGFMEFQFLAWLCTIDTTRHITNGQAYAEEVVECLTVKELNDSIEKIERPTSTLPKKCIKKSPLQKMQRRFPVGID